MKTITPLRAKSRIAGALLAAALSCATVLTPVAATAAAPVPQSTPSAHESGPSNSPFIGRIIQIDRRWPSPVESLESTVTITDEPGQSGFTEWGTSFWNVPVWGTGAPSGNVVFQQRAGTNKEIAFTYTNGNSVRSLNPQAICSTDMNPDGSSTAACHLPFSWQEGVTYRATISPAHADGHDWWRLDITDTVTGDNTPVALVTSESTSNQIYYTSQWVNNTAQGYDIPTCAGIPRSTAVFGQQTNIEHSIRPNVVDSFVLAPCAASGRVICSGAENACTAAINPAAPERGFQLLNHLTNLCLETPYDDQQSVISPCHSTTNHHLNADETWRFEFAVRQEQHCLSASPHAPYAVSGSVCNDSAAQQWLYVPRLRTFFNPGSERCLAPEAQQLYSPVVTRVCTGDLLQTWTKISS